MFSTVAQPAEYFAKSFLPSNLGDNSPAVKFESCAATLAMY